MIAANLRTLDEWDGHPHAIATRHLPPITVTRVADGEPRKDSTPTRVLDCSRVLAGPIAGQLFAAHRADVLRIDSPVLPSVEICVMATGSGKRNAHVDLTSAEGASTMRTLLDGTDVWIDAYRPGTMADRGFDVDALPEGVVAVRLSAFDNVGPWAGRRGFDSIVQSTTGIVRAGAEASGTNKPTPLPVQALDYMTGFLAAGAAERARQHQRQEGGTWLVEVSLLRTRNWLLSLGGPHTFEPTAVDPSSDHLVTMTTDFGELTTPRPISGDLASPPYLLGTHEPVWR